MDLSMELVRGLSGWAFDQLAGSALMRNKSPNWYGHEFAGRRISKRHLKKDPLRSRIPLAVMIRSFANLMPVATAKELSEALRALNHGEVRPILEAANVKDHGKSYTSWKRRKEAVLRAAFRAALWKAGDKEKLTTQQRRAPATEAEKLVADAYGVDPGTIRFWRIQVAEELYMGAWEIDWEIQAARLAGQMAAGCQPNFGGDDLLAAKVVRLCRRYTILSDEAAGKRFAKLEERYRNPPK
jgi:hypothetical protein